jgi:hypothetical protein
MEMQQHIETMESGERADIFTDKEGQVFLQITSLVDQEERITGEEEWLFRGQLFWYRPPNYGNVGELIAHLQCAQTLEAADALKAMWEEGTL